MPDKERLEKWENYRLEMENFERKNVKLAKSFLDLGAYESAAKCAIHAEGARYMCGRMPIKKA